MKLFTRLTLPLSLLVTNVLAQGSESVVIPNHPINQPSDVQFTSGPSGFDSPKVAPVNETTWDWWFFDAVGPPDPEKPDERASVVVTFYSALKTGFDLLTVFDRQDFSSLTLAEVAISWPNDTLQSYFFNGTEARVTTVGDGASGVWQEQHNESARFTGTPDLRRYRVDLNASVISGSLELTSIAPAHYPCGPNEEGQTMQVAPHIGWNNAAPDAISEVDLDVQGEHLSFKGIGYHDKNWSDRNFATNVGVWYWGHARVGPYSIVWFDYLSPAPELTPHVSAYVSYQNRILVAQCSGITARPYGANTTYPPSSTSGLPEGFDVRVNIPGGDEEGGEQELHVRVQAQLPVSRAVGVGLPYARWIGPAVGSVGGRNYTGEALFEEFNFLE